MAWKWIVIKDCLILEVMNLIKWQDLCLLNLIVWNYKIQFSSTDIYKEINILLALCRYFKLFKKKNFFILKVTVILYFQRVNSHLNLSHLHVIWKKWQKIYEN